MAEKIHQFSIAADGESVTTIYNDHTLDVVTALGKPQTCRATHVEPDPNDSTKWLADLTPTVEKMRALGNAYDGPVVLGPFDNRAEALKAETDWLKEHMGQF